jgi:PemK-like, MazF-like toxin of type II toxin-antitoxin system
VNPGDVVLISLPQMGGGPSKLRPALLLVHLPGSYQSLLICGISTQIQTIVSNWDELIDASDTDFGKSGLRQTSLIRLSYLYAAAASEIVGVIGTIDATRLDRLLTRLAMHLHP